MPEQAILSGIRVRNESTKTQLFMYRGPGIAVFVQKYVFLRVLSIRSTQSYVFLRVFEP